MSDDYYVWASELNASGALVSTFRGSTATPNFNGGGTFFPRIGATRAGGFGMVYGLNYNKVYVERFSATGAAESLRLPRLPRRRRRRPAPTRCRRRQ